MLHNELTRCALSYFVCVLTDEMHIFTVSFPLYWSILKVLSWLANLVLVSLTFSTFICRACVIMYFWPGLKDFFKRAWLKLHNEICYYNTIIIILMIHKLKLRHKCHQHGSPLSCVYNVAIWVTVDRSHISINVNLSLNIPGTQALFCMGPKHQPLTIWVWFYLWNKLKIICSFCGI